MTEIELRNKYIKAFADLVGKCAEGGENHKTLLNTYNTLSPLPRGVKMVTSYDWCACTVTALAMRCGFADIFAKECSCTKQIEQWKAMGAWVENDAYIPKTGDIVYFAWDAPASGDFTSDVDHVGVVEKVEEGYIISIEGNKGNNINRRTFPINYRYIRGFAVPNYASLAKMEETEMIRYKTINDIPAGYRKEAQELIDSGALKGKGEAGLDVTEDMLRCMIINHREAVKINERLDKIVAAFKEA